MCLLPTVNRDTLVSLTIFAGVYVQKYKQNRKRGRQRHISFPFSFLYANIMPIAQPQCWGVCTAQPRSCYSFLLPTLSMHAYRVHCLLPVLCRLISNYYHFLLLIIHFNYIYTKNYLPLNYCSLPGPAPRCREHAFS